MTTKPDNESQEVLSKGVETKIVVPPLTGLSEARENDSLDPIHEETTPMSNSVSMNVSFKFSSNLEKKRSRAKESTKSPEAISLRPEARDDIGRGSHSQVSRQEHNEGTSTEDHQEKNLKTVRRSKESWLEEANS